LERSPTSPLAHGHQAVPLESRRSKCHPDGWRQVAAEADTDVAVWTAIDEEAARFGGAYMPTYEFECRDCQKRFDVIALITEHRKLKDRDLHGADDQAAV
jgi:hypothetical protein